MVRTSYPSPTFTGTYTTYFLEYHEVPVEGILTPNNEIVFYTYHEELQPYGGFTVCRGWDDGSSINPGSSQVAGDSHADRLCCSMLIGQPIDSPGDLYKIDW